VADAHKLDGHEREGDAMDHDLNRPEGLSAVAERVFDVLARHTMFPWPVLKTQCERIGVDPFRLTPASLDGQLLDNLAASVARFTSPAKGAEVRDELAAIIDTPSRRTSHSWRPRT
jgi:hypothetical protein